MTSLRTLYDVKDGAKARYPGSSAAEDDVWRSVKVMVPQSATANIVRCPCCGETIEKGDEYYDPGMG